MDFRIHLSLYTFSCRYICDLFIMVFLVPESVYFPISGLLWSPRRKLILIVHMWSCLNWILQFSLTWREVIAAKPVVFFRGNFVLPTKCYLDFLHVLLVIRAHAYQTEASLAKHRQTNDSHSFLLFLSLGSHVSGSLVLKNVSFRNGLLYCVTWLVRRLVTSNPCWHRTVLFTRKTCASTS